MHPLVKLGAFGGAFALAGIWPLAVGHIGEKVIHNSAQATSSDQYKLEVIEYDRGYLSSTVKTQFEFTDPSITEAFLALGIENRVVLISQLDHGLTGIDSVSYIEGWDEFPVEMLARTQLNGNTDFTVNTQQWNIKVPEEESGNIAIEPMTLTGKATVDGKVDFNFVAPLITASFEDGSQMKAADMSLTGETYYQSGIWAGTQNMTWSSVSAVAADGLSMFQMDNLKTAAQTDFSEDGSKTSSAVQFTIDSIQSEIDPIEIRDIKLDFALTDLDADSFVKTMKLLERMDRLNAEEVAELQQQAQTLIGQGFGIAIDNFSFVKDGAPVNGQWTMQLPAGIDNALSAPDQLIGKMTGKIDLNVSQAFVDQIPGAQYTVDDLIVSEWISEENSQYVFDGKIENGQLALANGKQVPLMMLFMQGMMMSQ